MSDEAHEEQGSSSALRPPTARGSRGSGSTFEPIDLKTLKLHSIVDLNDFAQALYAELRRIKDLRVAFYQSRMRERDSVLWVRKMMVALGIVALLATAIAGIGSIDPTIRWDMPGNAEVNSAGLMRGGLLVALGAYALVSALSLWTNLMGAIAAYFRSLETILALRDLWTTYEFEHAALLARAAGGDATATRAELMSGAQALVVAMDMLARTELGDWRGEINTSFSQLAAAAKDGVASAEQRLKDEFDKRLAKLEDARKSLATLDIRGEFVGDVEIAIDDGTGVTTGERRYALPAMPPGPHRLRISGADKDGKALVIARWIETDPGIRTILVEPG